MALFAHFHCWHLLLVVPGEEAAFPPLPTIGVLGQSPGCRLGRQKQAGCSPGGSSPPSLTGLSIPSCRARKAAANHRSLTGCFSVSVLFTFFDLRTVKCFPEEWVPFEMHILKVPYSINGLVFLSHLSQTP